MKNPAPTQPEHSYIRPGEPRSGAIEFAREENFDGAYRESTHALLEEIRSLKSANRELESFSCSIAHDLKVPLRAIGGHASILRTDYGDILDEEGKDRLDFILKNVSGMTIMIEKILEFSKIGSKALNKTPLDMTELVTQCLVKINAGRPNNAKVFTHSLYPATADPVLISQVITNLLDNAIKYSSRATNPVIHVRAVQQNDEVVYSIEDNGAGFNMQYRNKLFCLFERLHSRNEFEGSGIGLATVKRIVEMHGGKVWAEAEEGKGATFYFSLPSYRANNSSVREVSEKTTPMKSIFLVDDDEIMNFIHEKIIMTSHSCNIVKFTRPSETLKCLEQYALSAPEKFPGTIFLDINMPGMTGWEFMDQFEKLPCSLRKTCHVVMLSSSVDNRDIAKIKSYSSIKDFVSKPLTEEKLKALREMKVV